MSNTQTKKIGLLVSIFLSILFVTTSLNAQEKNRNFKVVQKTQSQITINFNLGDWELENKSENGVNLQTIKSDARHSLLIDETETLPIFSTLVAIPDGMDIELSTENIMNDEISTVNLRGKELINRESGINANYPLKQIVTSEPGQFRDFRIVNLNIYPFQYSVQNSKLNVIKSAKINLRFVPSQGGSTNTQTGYYSPGFDNMYSSLILNYDDVRDESTPTAQPVLLIIYPTGGDATFTSKLDEFVTWKKQKGYIVNIASTAPLASGGAGSSTTDIKSYIQTAYNNLSTRPDVVLFIGDAAGSYLIPTYQEYMSGWSYNSEGDYPYSLLAGGDLYGDVQLGRISISSSDDFVRYVAKVWAYERDIAAGSATWLNKMLLVSDPAQSGISTIYTNQYIHEISHAVNPSYTYTELYGSSPSVSSMNIAINQGVGFFNYRGWLGMSDWNPGSEQLNGARLNHGVFITCGTGTFASGTSTIESYLRLGTEVTPAGGITGIGMATTGTHTAFNNTLDIALFDGIFNKNMRNMGEALLYSKCNLQKVYGVSNYDSANFFDRICNLIGDPTVEVFVTVPKQFAMPLTSNTLLGTTTLEITVKDSTGTTLTPIAQATVNLWQSGNCNLTGYTDSNGKVIFTIPSTLSGSVTLTVSKHDYKPRIKTITLGGTGLVYQSSVIDDDTSGGTSGNNNQIINSGETIDYKINVKNTTSGSISSISATLSCPDPYIQLVSTALTFPTATVGSTVLSTSAARFIVSNACPDNHPITLYIVGTSSSGSWNSAITHVVRSPDLEYVSHTISGTNNYLEPGETTTISVSVINNGSESANSISAILRSLDSNVQVIDSLKTFGTIVSGASFSNTAAPFEIHAKNVSIPGMTIPMQLYLYNTATGFNDTESFTMTIGNSHITDPLGQDAYGYYIYDDGDINYPQCPTYSWVGIAPAEGGSGTLLSITDTGTSGQEGDNYPSDALETVTLPFSFKFYGIDYSQITVCSNGFVAFGTTNNADFRNGRLPGSSGPNPMIAPFWDDLIIPSGSGIYVYNDTSQNRYIIEWYLAQNGDNTAYEETFQVILYNPLNYPTLTGDGQIKIQYKVFNNVDSGSTQSHGNYSTVGIKNQTGQIGLEYTFNNQYAVAAKPLSNLSALLITTRPVSQSTPFVTVGQTLLFDTNSNGFAEPGEEVGIRLYLENLGRLSASNVSATISESDPWITISQPTASFGNIPGLGNATNSTLFNMSVLTGCPNNYSATINVAITATGYSWTRTFTITIYTTVLSFGNMIISDPSPGNNNGRLDPGETVTITMPLNNIGGILSPSGSATLASPTSGITINTGTASFSSIIAGGSANLTFNLTASSSMTIGTVASLVFSATAGAYTANKTETTAVGLIIETFETGNFSSYPWTFGGNANWTIDNTNYYAGSNSAKSGTIADYQSTTIQTVRVLPSSGVISFWYKVSSEANYDYLKFYVDGVLQNDPGWAGEIGWTQATYTLAAGTRTLKWEYMKDSMVTSGSDCAWVDDIIFPASTILIYPPQNLTALASHQSVRLNWAAPVYGTPTGYKIFRNSSLLTTVTSLTYTDLAVTNGITYSYYLKAVYTGTESDSTGSVNVTPNAIAPSNLAAAAGNGFVNLTWTATTGFRDNVFTAEFGSLNDRIINGYKVYRNGSPIATVTTTNYSDTSVINETTYSYYVTTVYASPAGESSASNTVSSTPTATAPTTVILGSGTSASGTQEGAPINIYYKSLHGQSVYTAAELNAAGVFGPIIITSVGFYISSVPTLALPNFIVRMKHTSEANVANWQTSTDMTTVYTNASYMPTAGSFNMLTLSSPFTWNGTDNIVMDTAFSLVADYSATGTVQYTAVTNGYRYVRNDNLDQTNVFTGGEISSSRPNIKFQLQTIVPTPVFSLNPTTLDYGNVYIGVSPSMTFTIVNTGGGTLSGQITTPAGFTVAAAARNRSSLTSLENDSRLRNTISYSLGSGLSQIYNLTFTPTVVQSYNGNVAITSNDAAHTNNILALTGSGIAPVFNSPVALTALAGNNSVSLSWTAPTGGAGTLSGYKVFRNSSLITPTPIILTSYNDSGLINGTLYSYYITAVYTTPAGESAASNTAQATPSSVVTISVNIGSGITNTSGTNVSPINISYKSVHGQSIYTAAELIAAGVTGPVNITQIGFNIATAPALALPNFIIRMKHTTETNVVNWQTVNNLVTVYSNASYMPTAGGYEMLTLSTPFLWNGIDNIVIDTAFSPVADWSNTGTLQYTVITSGFRAARLDAADQTNVFNGGYLYDRRANVRFTLSIPQPAAPVVTIEKVTEGIRLSWSEVSGATRYKILSSSLPDSGFTQITEVTATQFIDTALNPNLFYQVVAANGPSARER